MNQKYNLTKIVLENLGLNTDDKTIKRTSQVWWTNQRKKDKGGLRLTSEGFEQFQKADIKFYEVKFDEPLFFTNKLAIWVDQNIDCPFFITNKKIFVSSEKMAIQLVLFSGNIAKFQRAKERFAEKVLDNQG
jgi:hypothetical protein